jgi:hypothetical protein
MTSLNTSQPREVAARHLRRPPPAVVWMVLLGISAAGRLQSEVEADRVRAVAEAAAAASAAAELRRSDSLRLVQEVDSARRMKRTEIIALDERLHATAYLVSHGELHGLAVRARLDSATKLLARAARSSAMLALAQAQLSAVRQPVAADQSVRLDKLTAKASSFERRITSDSLARVKADSLRTFARLRTRTVRPAPQRPSHPPGASALCADGSYSYSANRRGTCSHHGGVAQWL